MLDPKVIRDQPEKIKKEAEDISLKLIRNPDILSLLNSLGPKSLWILGKMLKSAL